MSLGLSAQQIVCCPPLGRMLVDSEALSLAAFWLCRPCRLPLEEEGLYQPVGEEEEPGVGPSWQNPITYDTPL